MEVHWSEWKSPRCYLAEREQSYGQMLKRVVWCWISLSPAPVVPPAHTVTDASIITTVMWQIDEANRKISVFCLQSDQSLNGI